MAFKNYNNNTDNNTPVTNVFSSVTFSNPESKISQSRFSVSYFNKLMRISIALRNNAGSNDNYATYDTDNQVSVYVSFTKAKMLADMIADLRNNSDVHNICIELKNGLLKISDGTEYGSSAPCISISYADEAGNVNEVIYECKLDFYKAAFNYNSDGTYESKVFNTIEVDAIEMTLNEYYKASSYAIAASIMEASAYKRQASHELLKSIAEKVGVQVGGNKGGNFNNKTFLSNSSSGSSGSGVSMNGAPKGYESTTFDSIAGSM
jgi:hypothetical protein